jgi:hypothetical protein
MSWAAVPAFAGSTGLGAICVSRLQICAFLDAGLDGYCCKECSFHPVAENDAGTFLT